jgi:hypothetical protein
MWRQVEYPWSCRVYVVGSSIWIWHTGNIRNCENRFAQSETSRQPTSEFVLCSLKQYFSVTATTKSTQNSSIRPNLSLLLTFYDHNLLSFLCIEIHRTMYQNVSFTVCSFKHKKWTKDHPHLEKRIACLGASKHMY